ncbi:MAG: SBBP repeat-containing protein, partial [Acidobacteriota bacterium]
MRFPPVMRVFTLLLLIVSTYCGATASAETRPCSPTVQQFTSGAHILGFGADGYVVSNGAYALKVDYIGAVARTPVAENGTTGMNTRSTSAPSLGTLRYEGLWRGIGVTYDAPDGGIERSTWHMAPGADPSAIRLRYNRPVTKNADGTLSIIASERGRLTESAPIAWQSVGGERREVAVSFTVGRDQEIGFQLGAYDRTQPLEIDPTLVWNTFLGGAGNDLGQALALDGAGNVYVTGYSTSTWGTPLRAYSGGYEAFVAKLSTNGTLLWNTFLGGSNMDYGSTIAVDGSGNVYVGGKSAATWGTPVAPFSGGTNDGFVAKLSSTGSLLWNTFLGGTGNDEAAGIVADQSGNVYVAGSSDATWGTPARTFS